MGGSEEVAEGVVEEVYEGGCIEISIAHHLAGKQGLPRAAAEEAPHHPVAHVHVMGHFLQAKGRLDPGLGRQQRGATTTLRWSALRAGGYLRSVRISSKAFCACIPRHQSTASPSYQRGRQQWAQGQHLPQAGTPGLAEPEATAPPSLCVPVPRSAAVSTVSQCCCVHEEGDPIPDQAAFQERQ